MAKTKFKSGFAALIGRPNVGKSTLLNALIGTKISIISAIPQTTRHQIKGILNEAHTQLVFLDTPGVHNFKDPLAAHLNTIARRSLDGVDCIVYVVDVTRSPASEEKKVIRLLANQKVPLVMALNKVDKRTTYLNDYIALWQASAANRADSPLLYYIPISAKTGVNIDKLRQVLIEHAPEGEPFYGPQAKTDFPLHFRIADIIREKLFVRLSQELPHALAVEVENTFDKGKIFYVGASIYVQRDSQKKIIIGKKAEVLKAVGKEARADIKKIVDKKVFLDIRVRVVRDWQRKPRILKELGYWWV